MKHLVIGGTGTVGSQVVRELLARGEQVRVLTRKAEKTKQLQGVDTRIGDLLDPAGGVSDLRDRVIRVTGDPRKRFEEDPQKALAEMHSGLAPKGDEDRVFALAELSFVYAENSGERSYYLASAIYAYSFLLPGQHGTPPRGLDPRFRWAADIYNQALTRAAML